MNNLRCQLRWVLAGIVLACLSSTCLYAQSIQTIAGTLDVIGTGGGFSGGTTNGQLLVPVANSDGGAESTVWFSPGDGSGGYVHCAVPEAGCTTADITSMTDVLTYNGAGGDSPSGTFWVDNSGNVSCMLGSGTVTKTTFAHKLDKTTGILTVKGAATVSGSVNNYSFDLVNGGCDQSSLIASYTLSGAANYTAQFTRDTSGSGDYIFQWMHISFNQ